VTLENIEKDAARLLDLCAELRAENERMKGTLDRAAMTDLEDPQHELVFQQLVGIVAEEFGVRPELVASRVSRHAITPARHLVAAIWSETRTTTETAARCKYQSPVTVMYARNRVARMMDDPKWADTVQRVIDRVREEMPHLLRVEPVEPDENTSR
jgi:chromosomal replication initiation ATPase DnaA